MASASGRILIVDDEAAVRSVLSQLLHREGYECLEAADGEHALVLVRREPLDAILLDIRMPDVDGLEVLGQIKLLDRELPVIIVSADDLLRHAVTALQMGAHDYLVKPFENADVLRSVRTALRDHGLHHTRTVRSLSEHSQEGACLRDTMGSSEAIATLSAEVARVARSDFTVLILGETGAGKELVSRAIHAVSSRALAPFEAVDCGAIPDTLFESELFGHEKGAFTGSDRMKPGRFEVVGAGTLFLDEISNIPRGCQAKLLRALQERKITHVGGTKPLSVGARVVAASNVDLETAVTKGLFRSDLYFRVSEFVIQIPPLRERKQDIVYLAQRFAAQTSRHLGKGEMRFSERALHQLLNYSWPGNVRQLCSTVRRAVLLADEQIHEQHLGLPHVSQVPTESLHGDVAMPEDGASLKQIIRRTTCVVERTALVRALTTTGGNKAKAARMLHIDYKTMLSKVKAHGLKTQVGG